MSALSKKEASALIALAAERWAFLAVAGTVFPNTAGAGRLLGAKNHSVSNKERVALRKAVQIKLNAERAILKSALYKLGVSELPEPNLAAYFANMSDNEKKITYPSWVRDTLSKTRVNNEAVTGEIARLAAAVRALAI